MEPGQSLPNSSGLELLLGHLGQLELLALRLLKQENMMVMTSKSNKRKSTHYIPARNENTSNSGHPAYEI